MSIHEKHRTARNVSICIWLSWLMAGALSGCNEQLDDPAAGVDEPLDTALGDSLDSAEPPDDTEQSEPVEDSELPPDLENPDVADLDASLDMEPSDSDEVDSGPDGVEVSDGEPRDELDADLGDDEAAEIERDEPDVDIEFEPDTAADTDVGEVVEMVDRDADGLDDTTEEQIIDQYLPFLSVHPDDGCPLALLVYRVRPHPNDDALIHVVVDVLFERDCGAGGHVGDNEVFGMTVDPAISAPDGILAIRAISHQATLCEHTSNCGSCAGLSSCSTAERSGTQYPVVYYSSGKHGAYLSEAECDFACFLTNYCELSSSSANPPRVNAGEPGFPLVTDLTEAGLITEEAGWTEPDLYHFDVWGPHDFGGAGNVADDLTDEAFLTPTCN